MTSLLGRLAWISMTLSLSLWCISIAQAANNTSRGASSPIGGVGSGIGVTVSPAKRKLLEYRQSFMDLLMAKWHPKFKNKQEGEELTARVTVSPEGKVLKTLITSSSGNREAEQELTAAIERIKAPKVSDWCGGKPIEFDFETVS